MWKIQQAMQDDAIRTARIHPAVHPGNLDEVFIWQNFRPAYRDLGVDLVYSLHLCVNSCIAGN